MYTYIIYKYRIIVIIIFFPAIKAEIWSSNLDSTLIKTTQQRHGLAADAVYVVPKLSSKKLFIASKAVPSNETCKNESPIPMIKYSVLDQIWFMCIETVNIHKQKI